MYSVILFLFKFKGKETKKKLFRDSHIYSKVILKAREITTTKLSYPGGEAEGWALEGVYKKMQCSGNVM